MVTRSGASQALHYSCALTAIVLVTLFFVTDLGLDRRKIRDSQRCRLFSTSCAILVALSYAVEAIGILLPSEHAYLHSQAHFFHMTALTFVWCMLWARSNSVSHEIGGLSLVSLGFDLPLLVLFSAPLLDGWVPKFQLACQMARILVLIALLVETSCVLLSGRGAPKAETQPILGIERCYRSAASSTYGTEALVEHSMYDNVSTMGCEDEDSDSDSDDDEDADIKRFRARRLQETGSWWAYLKDFSIMLPFLIPHKDRKTQCCYFVTLLCVAGYRVLNVLVPLQLGIVADELSGGKMPYQSLAIWWLLSLLSEESGIGLIQELATITIKQFSCRQIANAAFGHVMSLGMDFHADRDAAEVMKAVEQGSALTTVLETAVIEILPTTLDLVIAVFLLYSKFNAYVSLAMIIASVVYLSLEVRTANWNTGNRRQVTKADRHEAKIMHQAVQGWQTVYYFNMFLYERYRFGNAVERQLKANRAWSKCLAYTNALLHLFVPTTFVCLLCLVFLEFSQGRASTGDFVFLIQYWERLISPLTYLSEHYRWLQSDLIDAERLLDLLQTKPTIVDRETAEELGPVKGQVAFEHVYFSYHPPKSILEDVDFSVSPGETIALVGETGAGKSTIVKLLLRFFDINSGSIKIDGRDLRDITLNSLRNALGLIPQDPLLFNATIIENLRYARHSASDSEIEGACRSAAIHDKIMTLSDGYNTKVGENGVKLSGGEIQRLAIARVFLKDPPILILDEATSAVDTVTEAEIQSVLARLRKTRTIFVIAHRLSTVVDADRILVMHEGRIVESGTHRNLVQRESGRYKDLWMRQVEGMADPEKQQPPDTPT